MEAFHGLDVLAVCRPCFAAIEEGGDTDGIVDSNLGVQVEVVILEDPAADACLTQF